MFLIETTTVLKVEGAEAETNFTFDADMVCGYMDLGKNSTALVFAHGGQITISYDYRELMIYLVENGDKD